MKKRSAIAGCVATIAVGGAMNAGPVQAATDSARSDAMSPMIACSTSRNAPDITRDAAVSRGQIWFHDKIGYSQAKCHNDATLGNYRMDCSGYVSMAWDLPHSYTTFQFDPYNSQFKHLTKNISWSSLRAGDALVLDGGGIEHIGLFAGWQNSAHTSFRIMAESDPREGTTSKIATKGNNLWSYWRQFHPIRYKHIQNGPGGWAALSNGRLRMLQAGASGSVYMSGIAYRGGSEWTPWTNMGKGDEKLSNPPSLVHHGVQYDMFATGPDGYIWHRIKKNGSWDAWYRISTDSGFVRAKPGVGVSAVYGNGAMRLFYVSPGNHVYQTYYSDGWHSKNLKGDFRGTASALIRNGRMDVYAIDADGHISHKVHPSSGSWSTSWTPVTTVDGGQAQAKKDTGVTVLHGNGQDRIYYIGPGNQVYQTHYDDGWVSQNLHGDDLRGVPAVVITGNEMSLMATDATGNVDYRHRKIGGHWTAWKQVASRP